MFLVIWHPVTNLVVLSPDQDGPEGGDDTGGRASFRVAIFISGHDVGVAIVAGDATIDIVSKRAYVDLT